MEKKVTVKDVAKAAGVSVATVSYIMNDRTDQKISPETKKKVLQIANLLNYRPSHAAKSLVTGRNNMIGFAYQMMESTPSRNLELSSFMQLLIERMNRMKYDVVMLPVSDTENCQINRNVDAIIAIDLEAAAFRALADNYMVPVIGVDMIINDSLFFQIYENYSLILEKAIDKTKDNVLIMDKFMNLALNDFIEKSNSISQVLTLKDATPMKLSLLEGKNTIILGNYLALMLYPYMINLDTTINVIAPNNSKAVIPKKINLIHYDIEKKANLTMNVLLNALDRNFDIDHDIKIF